MRAVRPNEQAREQLRVHLSAVSSISSLHAKCSMSAMHHQGAEYLLTNLMLRLRTHASLMEAMLGNALGDIETVGVLLITMAI